MLRIEERLPSPDEYRTLRQAVGWAVPEEGQCQRALEESVAAVCGVVDGELAGMARVVGDGTFYSLLVDVVVKPEYQRRGVGRAMAATLEEVIARDSVVPVISLVAAQDVVPYWEGLGFSLSESMLLSKRCL